MLVPEIAASWGDRLVLWLVFLVISLGLGYPVVSRYDIRFAGGLEDTREYYKMVENGTAGQEQSALHRALVPMLARPLYLLLQGRTRSWNPVALSLLTINASLCALTAIFVFQLGGLIVSPMCGLVASLLFLLNFNVANFVLSGLIDALQALMLASLAWFLLREQWTWAAVAAAVGAVGKEVSLPMGVAFVWGWMIAIPGDRRRFGRAALIGSAALCGTLTMPLLLRGQFSNLFRLSEDLKLFGSSLGDYLQSLWRCVGAWNLWVTLGWILPGSVAERRQLPAPWWIGSLSAGAAALVLAAWGSAGSNFARPAFNVFGPILCVGTAAFLTNRFGAERS